MRGQFAACPVESGTEDNHHVSEAVPARHWSIFAGCRAGALYLPPRARSPARASATCATPRPVSNDPGAAMANGYDLLTDASGLACIDQSVRGDGHPLPQGRPGRGRDHRRRPVRRRWCTSEPRRASSSWRRSSTSYCRPAGTPPTTGRPLLFGQQFMLTPGDNRYGLPAFYSLHAWIWKSNPTGMFSMWNPAASCGPADVPGTPRCRGRRSRSRSRRGRDGRCARRAAMTLVAAKARLTMAKATIALAGPPGPVSAR